MIRPGAAFLAAPIFGATFVPVQVRADHRAGARHPGARRSPPSTLPADGLASMAGFMLVAGEVIAGLAHRLRGADRLFLRARRGRGDRQCDGPRLRRDGRSASGQPNPVLGQFLIDRRDLALPRHGRPSDARPRSIVESYHALPPGDAWLAAEASAASSSSARCSSPPASRSPCRSPSRSSSSRS